MKATANCIVCGKELERDERDPEDIVYGGVFLKTTGAYGSGAYDALLEPIIETVICDDCYRARKHFFTCGETCEECMERSLEGRPCQKPNGVVTRVKE